MITLAASSTVLASLFGCAASLLLYLLKRLFISRSTEVTLPSLTILRRDDHCFEHYVLNLCGILIFELLVVPNSWTPYVWIGLIMALQLRSLLVILGMFLRVTATFAILQYKFISFSNYMFSLHDTPAQVQYKIT